MNKNSHSSRQRYTGQRLWTHHTSKLEAELLPQLSQENWVHMLTKSTVFSQDRTTEDQRKTFPSLICACKHGSTLPCFNCSSCCWCHIISLSGGFPSRHVCSNWVVPLWQIWSKNSEECSSTLLNLRHANRFHVYLTKLLWSLYCISFSNVTSLMSWISY